jgi:uncharacterized protein
MTVVGVSMNSTIKFLPQILPIVSFGDGGFRFGSHSHLGSLLVLPSGMMAWTIDGRLKVSNFSDVLAVRAQIDIFLLGTGAHMLRPPREVLTHLAEQGLNVDFMSTSSAVHTYNVLLAEGRRLAAGMVAV